MFICQSIQVNLAVFSLRSRLTYLMDSAIWGPFTVPCFLTVQPLSCHTGQRLARLAYFPLIIILAGILVFVRALPTCETNNSVKSEILSYDVSHYLATASYSLIISGAELGRNVLKYNLKYYVPNILLYLLVTLHLVIIYTQPFKLSNIIVFK